MIAKLTGKNSYAPSAWMVTLNNFKLKLWKLIASIYYIGVVLWHGAKGPKVVPTAGNKSKNSNCCASVAGNII